MNDFITLLTAVLFWGIVVLDIILWPFYKEQTWTFWIIQKIKWAKSKTIPA